MLYLSVHKSQHLLPEARHALESILGRPLHDDDEVAIQVSRPHEAPRGEPRERAWQRLSEHTSRMAEKSLAPDQELEALVDEVANEVRHGKS
jgi:hypothetical protein